MTPFSFEWQWNIEYAVFFGLLYVALGLIGGGGSPLWPLERHCRYSDLCVRGIFTIKLFIHKGSSVSPCDGFLPSATHHTILRQFFSLLYFQITVSCRQNLLSLEG